MKRGLLTPWEPFFPPPPLEIVKFIIYDAILLKFESEHFHMFTNNDFAQNLYMEVPLPSPPPSKSQVLHL